VLHEISSTLASHPQYFEITYPLDIGLPPSEDNWQTPERQPRVKSYIHARRPEWTRADLMHQAVVSTSSETAVPPESGGVREIPPMPELKAATGFEVEYKTPGGSRLAAQFQGQPELQPSTPTRERLSDRDLKANRTFAILKMLEPGDNPWDLGTKIANWETVMGISVWDWFLPVRRSPCCNHEDTESHFMIGPWVDLLRCKVGFLAPENKPDRGRRLKLRRGIPASRASKGKRPASIERGGSHQLGNTTEMQDLNINVTATNNP
jgi:palmitoyltransferase